MNCNTKNNNNNLPHQIFSANLPPNMIFDYAENKDKFLTKTVKRRDFNDGVKQIEHDFANNVPLEQVVGLSIGVSCKK